MPIVFRDGNVRFHFYSNEGSPRQPIHIHADRGNAEAKLRLFPDVQIAGFTRREQADLVRIVTARREQITRSWHDHFG